MHELAVTESILEIANQAAVENGSSRVTDIYLTIGQLSSIVDDSVQFYWDHISRGTPSEGALLHFQRVPARLRCKNCAITYELNEELMPCPACGSIALEIISGEELLVHHIEILKEEE
ncbi:MAG: hydrogenase maturation nickel metallochaperone HypA [Anaerolineaceae bacterium]